MTLSHDAIRIDYIADRPRSGMWHCGPNNGWIIATHTPTQSQIRLYGRIQHRDREKAMALLELAVDEAQDWKAQFP